MKTSNKLINYSDIVEYAQLKSKDKTISQTAISHETPGYYYGDERRNLVVLNFTLHGDYVGTTVEKSNYHVLCKQLKNLYLEKTEQSIYDIFELGYYEEYDGSYSAQAICITGDLPSYQWEFIKQTIEAVEQYPIICENDWSEREYLDCYNYFIDDQYLELVSDLEKKYDIDLECDRYTRWIKKHNFSGVNEFLWEIINDSEICPTFEQLDRLEVNASAYYDLDNDDLLSELANYLRTI